VSDGDVLPGAAPGAGPADAPDAAALEVPDPAPPKRRRPVWLRLLQLALVAAAVYFVAAYLVRSWSSIQEFSWSLEPGWLALSGAAFLLFYLMQAVVWWLVLRGVAVRVSLLTAAATWAKSVPARYIPGTVFMFVGRVWLSHDAGMPADRVTAAMVYEQALGVCSALVTVGLLFPFWESHRGATALALLAVPVLVALLHPRVFAPLARRALRVLHRPPLEVTLRFGAVVALLAYFVVSWFVAGAGAWALARSLTGLEVNALPAVVVANALAYVAGMVAFFIPSGIGVREAVLTATLARQLPGGVALVWALLLRVWVTVVELAFVGIVVAVEAAVRRRRRTEDVT
jgi:glycosyltransferase 2 family protein